MNSDWQAFLEQAGATIEDGTVVHFGEREAVAAFDSDIMTDLSHFGLVQACGEDSRDFLQGQTSNDLRLVDASHGQLNSYCSPKGRMLATFRLFERDGDFYLQMPSEILEPTMKRLGMFILMSRVVLRDVSDELVKIGLAGPNAEKLLATEIGEIPSDVDGSLTKNGLTVIRLSGHHPRFEIVGELEKIQSLWEALSSNFTAVASDAWSLLDIRAGIPHIFQGSVETFVPQMVNLHLINGVSFKKGCYPGQEIVARMQYLGKLKRRMYLAHADSSNRPAPGEQLFSREKEGGQGAGNVVYSAPAPEGGYDLLVVVDIDSWENGTVHLDSENGSILSPMELPYTFEQEESA